MVVRVFGCIRENPEEPEAVAAYFRATLPLLEKAGAQISEQFEISEVLMGGDPGSKLFVVSYPDMKAVQSVFGSEEYSNIKGIRDKAFLTYSISVLKD